MGNRLCESGDWVLGKVGVCQEMRAGSGRRDAGAADEVVGNGDDVEAEGDPAPRSPLDSSAWPDCSWRERPRTPASP